MHVLNGQQAGPRRARPLIPAHTRVTTYNANHANSPCKNSGDTNVMTEPAAPLAQAGNTGANTAGKKGVRTTKDGEARTLAHRLDGRRGNTSKHARKFCHQYSEGRECQAAIVRADERAGTGQKMIPPCAENPPSGSALT